MKVFIFIMMMIFSFSSKADEVYNFYFQKTAAEATKPSGTDLTSPSPIQELQKDVKQENPSKSKLKKMELGFSRSWVVTKTKRTNSYGQTYDDGAMRNSFAVLGSYRFNKYVAADGGLYMFTGWREKDYKAIDTSKSVEGSLGLSITPLHLNVFGYELLEVGVIGGVMTMSKYNVKEKENSHDIKSGEVKKLYGAYLGPRASLNLTRDLGMFFDLKIAANMGAITSLGLRYRF